jgi:hypothetical protein
MARQMGTSALVVMGLWLGSLLVPGLSSAQDETVACAAWPGEPSPLPRLDHPDPFLARWAQLRAQELARMAGELESTDPRGAHETWEHFRCLDPAGELARLENEPGSLGTTEVAETPPVSSRPGPGGPDWSPIDAKIETAEALVRGARFQQALETANQIRPTLASIEDGPGSSLRRTQIEVLSATAQIALGRLQAAHESFERALAADPELELDAGSTSPKIRRVFETVRGESGSPAR